jgi:hypothetical protein
VVAQAFEAEAIGEDVQVEEGVVGGFPVFEGGRLDGARVKPSDEEFKDLD